MLRITVDIFSGRENPSWILEDDAARKVLRELALNRAAIGNDSMGRGALGYRGTRLEILHEHVHEEFNLPSAFAIANGASANEQKAIEIVTRLIEETGSPASARRLRTRRSNQSDQPTPSPAGELDNSEFRKFLIDEITKSTDSASSRESTRPPGTRSVDAAGITPCAFETLPFTPAYWNDPAHVRLNNCYAYAANRRTDTFPQPGRASGHPTQTMACSNVTAASASDGAHQENNCFPDTVRPRLHVAMVIWPGRDYHWYRLHSEGFWGHKPGQTPARNVDNSNVLIRNPQACNRGGYTDFCGYFLIPNNIAVR